jgi:hypothetical protein
MMPPLHVAHAAVAEAGHPELCERIIAHPVYGVTILSPVEWPHIAIKAVALAHQAAGHLVTADYEPGHAHFECVDCGLS